MAQSSPIFTDPHIERLRLHFLEHPVWVDAAQPIQEGAESLVVFSHVPGIYHLYREKGKSLLLYGPPKDPDFGFRFTPRSIEMLTETQGDVGDFAVTLFSLITHPDPQIRVGFRVYAPFTRLLTRGYVHVLLRGGPKVLQYAAQKGIRTLPDLYRLFQELRTHEPLESTSHGDRKDPDRG